MNPRWLRMMAAGFLAASACSPRPAVPPPVPTEDPTPPPALANGTQLHTGGEGPLRICVVENGRMTMTPIEYDLATGDTTVNGRPFREAYPVTAEHAAGAQWYVNREPITFRGRRYVMYGLPRVLSPMDIVPVDTYRGVTVFAEPSGERTGFDVLYLSVTPDCQFQPYQTGETGGAVRG